MPANPSDKVRILDMEARVQARTLVYDERVGLYLSPPLPDHEMSNNFFGNISRLHKEGHTGAGITVGIVDTGLMLEHPALRKRVNSSKLMIKSGDEVDRNGHGTLVALLILAIAPDVTFVSVKALNDQGVGTRRTLIEGMKWASRQGIQILNLSVGLEQDERASECLCDVCSEANRLGDEGIWVCSALGNNPQKSYHPASARNAITAAVLGEKGFPSYILERPDHRLRETMITVPQFVVPTLGGVFDGATSMGAAYLSGISALLFEPLAEDLTYADLADLEKRTVPKEEISKLCLHKGLIFYRRHQIPQAIEWYKLSLAYNPSFDIAHYDLGMAYVQSKMFVEAEREFQWVLKRDPWNVQARINVGHVYNLVNQDDKAIEAFRRVLELEPSSALAMKNLAFMLTKNPINNADDQDPETLLRQAVMIDPNNAEIHNDLGTVYESRGKLPAAMDSYDTAIRLDPNWELPKRNLARVLQRIKSLD